MRTSRPRHDSVHAALSLDIGGTKLAVGIVDPGGNPNSVMVEPTRRDDGPDVILPRLISMARRSLQTSPSNVSAVGISCGGPLDPWRGVLLNPPHLPGWINIPITRIVEDALGLPTYLENDATAAALGEYRYGAGRGSDTMLYLTLSTGVGGGAVIGGRLHRGAAGNGGELGHVLVQSDGRICSCGRRGCLEAYASGTNIAQRAQERLVTGETSVLTAIDKVSAADVSYAASQGDPLAVDVWNETIELLGIGLTDLVNVFEPEKVILGGGVTRSGDMLLQPLRALVAAAAMPPCAGAVTIELAGLGQQSCLIGAGAVAFDREAMQ